mgnify:CR=1 FL=1
MAKTSLLKRQAEVYLRIAHRQLDMAEALLGACRREILEWRLQPESGYFTG